MIKISKIANDIVELLLQRNKNIKDISVSTHLNDHSTILLNNDMFKIQKIDGIIIVTCNGRLIYSIKGEYVLVKHILQAIEREIKR